MMNREDTRIICRNCKSPVNDETLFCPVCGQRQHTDHLRLRTVLSDFFSTLLNIDNRIFRTLKAILIPGKLTQIYKRGEIRSYLTPARLFLVTLILHFAIYSTLIDFGQLKKLNDQTLMDVRTKELCHEYELLSARSGIVPDDSIKLKLFKSMDCSKTDTFPATEMFSFMNLNIRSVGLETKDVHTMTLSEIDEKYTFPGWKEKYVAFQLIKFTQNPVGGVSYIIANMAWGVVLVILLSAVFLKLLYFRQKPYFVELVTLQMHDHAFIFILSLILIYLPAKIFGGPEGIPGIFISGMIIISIVYIYLSLKFYFKQSWIKTFLKFSISGVIYLVLMLLFAGLVSLSSLFLF